MAGKGLRPEMDSPLFIYRVWAELVPKIDSPRIQDCILIFFTGFYFEALGRHIWGPNQKCNGIAAPL